MTKTDEPSRSQVRVMILLTPALARHLELEAKRRICSRSYIVRELLERGLPSESDKTDETIA